MALLPTWAEGGLADDDALGGEDMCALLERLARRRVHPDELVRAARRRLEEVNPRINAVTQIVRNVPSPGDSAGPALHARPLAGIPTVIKDNADLAGYPTTHGSRAAADRVAVRSSAWVSQFLGLGVTPIAKSTLPEFGLTASTESTRFGATLNPWDLTRSAGGSSGGSAALVAAGVVPIAHANDGGGSIRIPASCCGVVGLKPSRGRLVDRPEMARMPVPIASQGVLTRSVRDTARYLAEAERLYASPDLPAIGHVVGPCRRRLRIGVVSTGLAGSAVDGPTQSAVARAAKACERLGHDVEEIDPPVGERFGRDFLIYWAMISFSLRYGGRWLVGPGFDGRRVEALTAELADLVRRLAPRLPGALRRLRRLAARHEAAFEGEGLDVVLSPVTGHVAPPIGFLGPDVEAREQIVRLLRFTTVTPLQNVSGSPAMSLPAGRTADGLPVGVHLAAGFGQERTLLELAYALEEALAASA